MTRRGKDGREEVLWEDIPPFLAGYVQFILYIPGSRCWKQSAYIPTVRPTAHMGNWDDRYSAHEVCIDGNTPLEFSLLQKKC